MTEPRQPWVKEQRPLEAPSLERAMKQLDESAQRRHNQLILVLIFLPMVWGAIAAVLWYLVLH